MAFTVLLSGVITGFILFFILLRSKSIIENEILTFIIGLAIFGLVYYILMMLFRPLLGINGYKKIGIKKRKKY